VVVPKESERIGMCCIFCTWCAHVLNIQTSEIIYLTSESLYFLQNVSKFSVFCAFEFKVCKKANISQESRWI
jgi:hypothetical protein